MFRKQKGTFKGSLRNKKVLSRVIFKTIAFCTNFYYDTKIKRNDFSILVKDSPLLKPVNKDNKCVIFYIYNPLFILLSYLL